MDSSLHQSHVGHKILTLLCVNNSSFSMDVLCQQLRDRDSVAELQSVGVLMEVNQATRLAHGDLLVLASAVGRIRVSKESCLLLRR